MSSEILTIISGVILIAVILLVGWRVRRRGEPPHEREGRRDKR